MTARAQGRRSKEQEAASPTPAPPIREPTPLRFVSVRDVTGGDGGRGERELLVKVLTCLSWTSVCCALVLLLCQVGAAICLCRPVAVLGGTIVSFLLLCQGWFGHYVARVFSQTLLVGAASMSAFVALSLLGAALYLLSGHYALLCVSSFHSYDQQTAARLHIVECVSLASCAPCLMGVVACLMSAALSAKASQQQQHEPRERQQVFLYLHPPQRDGGEAPGAPPTGTTAAASAPELTTQARATTPPPSYTQINEESFA